VAVVVAQTQAVDAAGVQAAFPEAVVEVAVAVQVSPAARVVQVVREGYSWCRCNGFYPCNYTEIQRCAERSDGKTSRQGG
jgi:hypothetical protein